jgi:hypothetical protein
VKKTKRFLAKAQSREGRKENTGPSLRGLRDFAPLREYVLALQRILSHLQWRGSRPPLTARRAKKAGQIYSETAMPRRASARLFGRLTNFSARLQNGAWPKKMYYPVREVAEVGSSEKS